MKNELVWRLSMFACTWLTRIRDESRAKKGNVYQTRVHSFLNGLSCTQDAAASFWKRWKHISFFVAFLCHNYLIRPTTKQIWRYGSNAWNEYINEIVCNIFSNVLNVKLSISHFSRERNSTLCVTSYLMLSDQWVAKCSQLLWTFLDFLILWIRY